MLVSYLVITLSFILTFCSVLMLYADVVQQSPDLTLCNLRTESFLQFLALRQKPKLT